MLSTPVARCGGRAGYWWEERRLGNLNLFQELNRKTHIVDWSRSKTQKQKLPEKGLGCPLNLPKMEWEWFSKMAGHPLLESDGRLWRCARRAFEACLNLNLRREAIRGANIHFIRCQAKRHQEGNAELAVLPSSGGCQSGVKLSSFLRKGDFSTAVTKAEQMKIESTESS